MSQKIWNRTLVLTAIAVTGISAVSLWLAWQNSPDLVQRISVLALAPILLAAIISYSLRVLRLHYFLTRSGIAIPLRGTAAVEVMGFALSVTPGHIGEVFKLNLIRVRTGVSELQTAPILLLVRLTEGGGFLILAFAATLALPGLRSQIPASNWLLVGLGAIVAFALVRRFLPDLVSAKESMGDPPALWQRLLPHLRNLWRGLEQSFTLRQVAGGLAISITARFADGLVVLFAAHMLGVELTLPMAVLVLAISGLAGGLSLLPGGAGAVETTMVGLLALAGATVSNALTITLLARMFSLWMWVGLGLTVVFASRLAPNLVRNDNFLKENTVCE
jgi:glycosyltransferase 2 family protein